MSDNSEAVTVEQETAVEETEAVVETEAAAAVEVDEVVVDEETPPSAEASTPQAEAELEAEAEVVEAEAVEAEAVEAEAVEAEAVEAEAVEAEAVEAEAVEAEAVEAEAVEAEAVEAEAVEAEAVEETEEVVAEEASSEEASAPESADADDSDTGERVVRVLSVGMEVDGTVKRTTEFGAFVDIGVGRDGLIHISELSVRRVAKVSDVVKEGQAVTAWIKELDRSRNRISLTLIPPGTKTIRDLQKDEIVTGTVTRIVPYGAFVDIGVGRDALLHIREMADGYINKPEDVVEEGATVEARIIEISRRRGRIDLSMKGMNPEAEAEEEEAREAEEDELIDDPFEDMEVLSPMELAFQKAMSEDDEEVEGVTRRRNKRTRRQQMRSMQDEIISRTLKTGRQG